MGRWRRRSAVKVLLDTHAFIWWDGGNERLSEAARRAIADEANDILVSAASAWEIVTKHRLGRLSEAEALALDVGGGIARQGFEALAISVDDGERAGRLTGPHRDPFDRMLAAQALGRNLTLVSIDRAFDQYGVRRLW